MSVTVYSKPSCVQCDATYKVLEQKNINYNVIDISQDTQAFEKVTGMGYRQVPVVVVGGDDHWAGFRPDKLSKIA